MGAALDIISGLRLRPMDRKDWPLMERWLNQIFIRRWLGRPEPWISEIRAADGDPSAWIRHFIAEIALPQAGRDDSEISMMPIGFAQYYECLRTPIGYPWQDERSGTFGIDYFIGEVKYLGRGLGSRLVQLICDKLIAERASYIIADPFPDNYRSIRVLKKAGFALDPDTRLYKRIVNHSDLF